MSCVLLAPFLPSIAHRNDDVDVGRYILKIRDVHWLNVTKLIRLLCTMVCLCNMQLLMYPPNERAHPLPFMSYLLPLKTMSLTSFNDYAGFAEEEDIVQVSSTNQ